MSRGGNLVGGAGHAVGFAQIELKLVLDQFVGICVLILIFFCASLDGKIFL